ncbi:MAG TPA: cytochrome c oxidase subunit II [Caulobacteraceae bacterium]|jgi:cytochrome c oxidase subunit 2|nr:cytochrome c oxidase subunit II [Caulobacteraceae bacterium]
MTSRPSPLVRRLAAFAAGVSAGVTTLLAAPALAAELVGQPTPKAFDMQPSASVIRTAQIGFHDHILMPIITAIVLLVLGLLLYIIVRFNKRANPTAARFSHNTPVEIIWTVVPVLILMIIAIFSFRLLFQEHDMPRPYMTVKVVGRQWNWDYAYPDQKIAAYTSTPMEQAAADAQHLPYLLAANAPMVVPVNQVVRVEVTGEDVIHSFSVPAFGIKIDAIPGRLNETWFKADRQGVFYGQCSQLCGINHSFMPIEVHVLSQPEFDAWVASKAAKPATTTVAAATPPAASAAPAAAPQ